MNTKRKLITIIIGIEAVMIAAVIVFLFYINSDTVRINRQLELAQRYLLEEDYEQAIAAFEIVIEIDPKNVDAYLGLAEAYVSVDELKNAVRTLEKAAEQTDSEEILDMLEIHTAGIEQRQLAAQKAAEAAAAAAMEQVVNTTPQQDEVSSENDPSDVFDDRAANDTIESEQSENAQDLYMRFLNNEIAAVVRKDGVYVQGLLEIFNLESGHSYTLMDLTAYVDQVYLPAESLDIEWNCQYTYVDCVDSDSVNLLIRFEETPSYDNVNIFFIITEDNGQLYVTGAYRYEGREELTVYCNGLCYSWGSGGAALNFTGALAIMSGGNITEIFEEMCCGGWSVSHINYEIYNEIFDGFDPIMEASIYTIGTDKYYTYTLLDAADNNIEAIETFINRCHDEAGINWTTEAEVLEAIKKRCSSIGVDYNSVEHDHEEIYDRVLHSTEYQDKVNWVML